MKEKLDKEVKQLHVDMEAKNGDIKALNLQGHRAKEEQQRLEQQLKELKVNTGLGHVLCMVLRKQTNYHLGDYLESSVIHSHNNGISPPLK